jgi:IS1 family transposase
MVYGQLIKIMNGSKLVDKYRRKVFGNPSLLDIDTVNIESYNSTLRGCVSRLVRRTKS